ncbi:DMT family transporter [Saccharopolyspora sp. NPDC002376]
MRPLVLAVGFVVLWSSGFVGASLAADVSTTSGMLAWRYLVTAVLLVVVVALRHRRPSLRVVVQQAVLGLLAHVGFLGGVFGAAGADMDAGTTALVCALQPMLVAAVGRLFWADRITSRQLVGLGLGLVAVGLTVGGADTSVGAAVLLPICSVLGLSGAALLERRWQPTTDVTVSLTIQVAVSAGVFTAYAAVAGTLQQVTPTTQFLAALAWLVALSGLGGYATFVLCLRRFGASFTSTLLYLTPPVTTLWAWAMFDDTPTVQQLGGLTLGALAVALAAPRNSGKPSDTATHDAGHRTPEKHP